MKRILIVFCLLIFALPCLAEIKPKLITAYPSQNIYYYYIPDFDINTFKKPIEVKTNDVNYTIFVYDKNLPIEKFKTFDGLKIDDDPGYLFSMLLTGIANKPSYYVFRTVDDNNMVEVNICKFNPSNEQVKYMLNPETGKFVKQVTFNNGSLGITSICNPNYVPYHDI